ncbi:alpha/beta hydrolase [Alcanivorax marinus]|uniref:Alpha/beta hydrolase n=1 Tax=Alloalcanivorax marinus TaxID=1177169 RepID=A0A9Q3UNI9_9GAMM|nr:alpha/beta hydrolase [Alloalcanivorax marinus]MCC4308724.1 alpha/beta hydrolase [Alloalcanivorax marinus]
MNDNNKPPVVLIHGMWSDADTLHEVRDAFAEQSYEVTALTLPNHHTRDQHTEASIKKLARTSLQDYVDFLVERIKGLREPPILVGHSMGGLLAQLTAARVPCQRLILLSSAAPAGINGFHWSVFRTLGSNLFRFPLWRNVTVLKLANVQYGIANAQDEDMQRDIFDHCGYESGRATFQITLAAFSKHHFAYVDPDSLNCPILVVGGTEDRITPIQVQRRIAERYGAHSQLVEIPGCCHWSVGGRFFGQIRQTLFDWLGERPAGEPSPPSP